MASFNVDILVGALQPTSYVTATTSVAVTTSPMNLAALTVSINTFLHSLAALV